MGAGQARALPLVGLAGLALHPMAAMVVPYPLVPFCRVAVVAVARPL